MPAERPTRREVLRAGATGGAALWVTSSATVRAAVAAAAPAPVPAALHRATYGGLVGDTFMVDGGTALRLDAVTDLLGAAPRGLTGSDDAFALHLTATGTGPAPLAQGTHPLRFPDGTEALLFVVPVGSGATQAYEVTVDRSTTRAPAAPAGGGSAPGDAPAPAGSAGAAGEAGGGVDGPRPAPRYGFLRNAAVRRTRAGLQARLTLAPGMRVRHVVVRVMRGDVTYARGRAATHGRALRVGLRTSRDLPRGHYDLVVEAVDAAGVRTVVRRPVRIG